MTRAIFDKYIHEYTDSRGQTRYAVAEWVPSASQYVRPLDARTVKLTGCSQEFCRNVAEFGGYLTRREALRRARYLWGTEEDQDA